MDMKTVKQMFQSLFFLILSIGLIVIGYVISGNSYHPISAFLFVAGMIGFVIGIFSGIHALTSNESGEPQE